MRVRGEGGGRRSAESCEWQITPSNRRLGDHRCVDGSIVTRFAGILFAGILFVGIQFVEILFVGILFAGILFVGTLFVGILFVGILLARILLVGILIGDCWGLSTVVFYSLARSYTTLLQLSHLALLHPFPPLSLFFMSLTLRSSITLPTPHTLQVTNPPIDPLREGLVMSLEMRLGGKGNLLNPGPDTYRQLLLDSPILLESELEAVKKLDFLNTRELNPTYEAGKPGALREALQQLADDVEAAVREGC